jgi:hypothetical protein
MRRTLVLGLLAAAATFAAAQAQVVQYKATLNGASEVPPVQTQATGAAAVNADPSTKGVSWSVTYTGLSGPATAAHIHCGAAAGANAGVAVSLGDKLTSPIQGSGTMTEAQMADLQAGKCYVNIHTAANKGGEVRGQLMK